MELWRLSSRGHWQSRHGCAGRPGWGMMLWGHVRLHPLRIGVRGIYLLHLRIVLCAGKCQYLVYTQSLSPFYITEMRKLT